jgi:hypothetical protein
VGSWQFLILRFSPLPPYQHAYDCQPDRLDVMCRVMANRSRDPFPAAPQSKLGSCILDACDGSGVGPASLATSPQGWFDRTVTEQWGWAKQVRRRSVAEAASSRGGAAGSDTGGRARVGC